MPFARRHGEPPVVYVHPRSGMIFEEILPLSLPDLVRRVPYPVLGRFEADVRPEELRAAEVVLMDVHWYSSLPSALALSRRVRTISPRARIVAGGLTASLFPRQLLRRSEID